MTPTRFAGALVAGIVALGLVIGPAAVVGSRVVTNSPGLLSGSGTATAPLVMSINVDGTLTWTDGTHTLSAAPTVSTVDFGLFGDGFDGASAPCGTISVNTSLSKTINCTSLTVNSGVTLTTNGWIVRVAGTLQLDGKISYSGADAVVDVLANCAPAAVACNELVGGGRGGNGASSGGAAGLGLAGSTAACAGPGQIAATECDLSTPADTACNTFGAVGLTCQGGAGGSGATGCTFVGRHGVGVTTGTGVTGTWRSSMSAAYLRTGSGHRGSIAANAVLEAGTGGSGGGWTSSSPNGTSHAGCGGAGGGNVVVLARKILGSGSIESHGGNGTPPYNGTGNCTSCGGGGGGSGGLVTVIIGTGSFPTVNVAGGTGGNGAGTGFHGGDGGIGLSVQIKAGL